MVLLNILNFRIQLFRNIFRAFVVLTQLNQRNEITLPSVPLTITVAVSDYSEIASFARYTRNDYFLYSQEMLARPYDLLVLFQGVLCIKPSLRVEAKQSALVDIPIEL